MLLKVFVLAGCLSACSASLATAPSSLPSPTVDITSQQVYVSIGDSYAAGLQPTEKNSGHTTTNGFAYQVTAQAKASGRDVQLVNFGCSGATTSSVLNEPGCAASRLGPNAPSYDGMTQAEAAVRFITANRSKIALITVILGGNDLMKCELTPTSLPCFQRTVDTMSDDLNVLLTRLNGAVDGTTIPVVGITYPDILLGKYLTGNSQDQMLATESIKLFANLFNPRLRQDYESHGARFVDITTLSGALSPFSQIRYLPPYGSLPEPVARICELTYLCQYGDVHPTTEGYALIADAVIAAWTS